MMKALGFVLLGIGVLCFVWFLFVAGGFALVSLSGFVGTDGREAGGELVTAVLAVLLGCGIGVLVAKTGARLISGR